MQEIELESNFNGDLILEADSFEGEYDQLFKGIRKAVKERGVLGGLGQLTGLSTNKGTERRQARREARLKRKADRNDRKNILVDAKANQKNAEAESQVGQATMLAAIAQEPQADKEKPKSKTMLWVGIGAGVLLLAGVIVILVLRKK